MPGGSGAPAAILRRVTLIGLFLVSAALAAAAAAAAPSPADSLRGAPARAERIVLRTERGGSFPVDWYRPSGPDSGATAILLSDPVDSLRVWTGLARRLAARGLTVYVPEIQVRRAAASVAVWGRPEDPGAPWAAAWEEVVAALAHAGNTGRAPGAVVLGGVGRGAAAAALAASRLPLPPKALLLVAPVRELTRLPLGPLLAGLAVPSLVLAPTDNRDQADAAREIYLAARRTCRLWTIDGYACSPRAIEARPRLAVDLTEWIARQLPGGLSSAGGAEQRPAETERH